MSASASPTSGHTVAEDGSSVPCVRTRRRWSPWSVRASTHASSRTA